MGSGYGEFPRKRGKVRGLGLSFLILTSIHASKVSAKTVRIGDEITTVNFMLAWTGVVARNVIANNIRSQFF